MPVPIINHETAEPQTLDEIREWHSGIADALLQQRASVLYSIKVSSAVSFRFLAMTEKDVDDYYDAQRRELDRLTMLNLVASAEAAIKVDYFRRVGEKLKDKLALAYRQWHKALPAMKQLRPNFDGDGMLEVLNEAQIMDATLVRRYRECLRVRHWIGHGRFWAKPVEVDRLDPADVYDRADSFLRAMPK